MKLFCTQCGAPHDVEAAASRAVLTCSQCGHTSSPNAPPPGPLGAPSGVGAPTPSSSNKVVVWIIAGVVLLFGAPCVLGIVAAIAIPNFIRYQSRAKQAECKSNLAAMYYAEKAFFEDRGFYTEDVQALGFSPERGNRYAYFAGSEGGVEDRSLAVAAQGPNDSGIGVDTHRYEDLEALDPFSVQYELADGAVLGVTGSCPDCSFTAVCMGNIDPDDALDVWSVSTQDRKAADGSPIPAGTVHHESDDLEESDSVRLQRLTSADGLTRVAVPAEWSERTDLNDVATLQAGSVLEDSYVVVITDGREELEEGTTIESYAESTVAPIVAALNSPVRGQPKATTIGGHPALVYEFSGELDAVKIAYVYAAVETPGHFHQVIAWANQNRYPGQRAKLENAVRSFRELAPEESE